MFTRSKAILYESLCGALAEGYVDSKEVKWNKDHDSAMMIIPKLIAILVAAE